ncbi:Rec10 / Red1 [Nakaseomyces glabratus]|nr:Rec10 / Red1 [Nakaseomyces glabratus]KAH7596190.1 Rec10 / Red1 [Nakaseomyces glabratus]KAH7611757.1 Rec10 / Red1 [Nakaseomyces glabratus]
MDAQSILTRYFDVKVVDGFYYIQIQFSDTEFLERTIQNAIANLTHNDIEVLFRFMLKEPLRSKKIWLLISIMFIELSHAKLQYKDIWIHLLRIQLTFNLEETDVPESNDVIINTLIDRGTKKDITFKNWKYFFILLKTLAYIYTSPSDDIQQLIISKFDYVKDFLTSNEIKDLNLLIMLISFLSLANGNAEHQEYPILRWKKQNIDKIFSNYKIMEFILDNFKEKLVNFVRIKKLFAVYESQNCQTKKIVGLSNSGSKRFCYSQFIHGNLYLWTGTNTFIHLRKKNIFLKKSNNCLIEIGFPRDITPFTQMALNEFEKSHIPMKYLKKLELEFNSEHECRIFLESMDNYFRISEAKDYLLLNFTESDTSSQIDNISHSELEFKEKSVPIQLKESNTDKNNNGHFNMQENSYRNTQLQTPERSDLKRNDKNDNDSIQNNKAHSNGEQYPSSEYGILLKPQPALCSSPLSDLNKKRLQRSLSKSSKNLKLVMEQQFKTTLNQSIEVMRENIIIPSSVAYQDHLIDKDLGRHRLIEGGRLTSQFVGHKPNNIPKVTSVSKTKPKSVKTADINVLNTIFGSASCTVRSYKGGRSKGKNVKPTTRSINKGKKMIANNSSENIHSNKTVKEKSNLVANLVPVETSTSQNRSKEIISHINSKVPNQEVSGSEDHTISLNNSGTLCDINTSKDANLSLSKSISKGAFSKSIQDQLANSINAIANQMISRISIINELLNKKIMQELSEKYEVLFSELHKSFKGDVERMVEFVGDLNKMSDLTEEEVIAEIRKRNIINSNITVETRRE